MPNLTGTTVVADRHGMPHLLRKGDPLPEWAAGKVGDHLLDDSSVEEEGAGPPPKAGPGSSKAAWITYATETLHLVDSGWETRDDVIEAVEAALDAQED